MDDNLLSNDNPVSANATQIVDLAMDRGTVFAKSLAANDTGATKSHQSGFLIPVAAGPVLFPRLDARDQISKCPVTLIWLDSATRTDSTATWYASKGEYRLTGGLRPILTPDLTGALLLLVPTGEAELTACCLATDADTEYARSMLGLSVTATAELLDLNLRKTHAPADQTDVLIDEYARDLREFPKTTEVSAATRRIWRACNGQDRSVHDPDRQLMDWINLEYRVFQTIEGRFLWPQIERGFDSVDDFIKAAHSVKNRRASRAGASLENHAEEILKRNEIRFFPQATTEHARAADFLFPGEIEYHDKAFPSDRLAMLAAKTTCKDRWRQVLNEAARIDVKHLLTLQKGVSPHQMDEMASAHVRLVVPKVFHPQFPAERRSELLTVKQFIDVVRAL